MKRNIRAAYTKLKALGAPVYEGGWNGEDTFRISGEDNGDTVWADYYEEFVPTHGSLVLILLLLRYWTSMACLQNGVTLEY